MELKNMTEADLQHAIDCAYDCDKGVQAAPFEAELKRRGADSQIADACVAALGDRGAQASEDVYGDSAKLFG